MYETAASCKDIVRALVTNWEPQCVNARRLLRREVRDESSARNSVSCHSQRYEVTLRGNVTGLRYAVTLQVFVQLVTPYRVTHLQRYEVTLRGNVTSVYPP
jgi:hypothetical protein